MSFFTDFNPNWFVASMYNVDHQLTMNMYPHYHAKILMCSSAGGSVWMTCLDANPPPAGRWPTSRGKWLAETKFLIRNCNMDLYIFKMLNKNYENF